MKRAEIISTKENSTTITLKLPKKWVNHLNYLEETTKKSKDFYVKEALIRHLEDLEDLETGLARLKKKHKVYYTSEELSKRLGI